jgi:hypothetical protein
VKIVIGATVVQIEGFGYRAVVTEEGACLRELEFLGRELIVSFAVDEPMIADRGALAAPWPNWIEDGHYEANGTMHQLPISGVSTARVIVAITGDVHEITATDLRTVAVRQDARVETSMLT